MLKGKTVLLGVTGSIAAYKIAGLASMLVKQGVKVHVLMTENATNFINPITFESLTGNKCLVDTFDRNFEFSVEHVALAKQADVVNVELHAAARAADDAVDDGEAEARARHAASRAFAALEAQQGSCGWQPSRRDVRAVRAFRK